MFFKSQVMQTITGIFSHHVPKKPEVLPCLIGRNRNATYHGHPLATARHTPYSAQAPVTEIQGESLLEINHLYILNTVPKIAELTEQVRIYFGWDSGKLRVQNVIVESEAELKGEQAP